MSRDNKQTAAKEKHLKSIYELLNRGCNKKAVQDIDKFPKNLRELTVFRSLKALALIRMSKRWQAFEVLNEINPEDDLDEVTLQTMTSCYKEAVDVEKIVELYEAASKRQPTDQEIMARLFMAHVRVFNFKRQKEIALVMYKNFPKKKRLYFFWAIMSLVMQSQEAIGISGDQADADRKVCLTLAERMCDKMIEEERTQEEIELYLTILRKQNKYEEEYRFLTGPLCSRLTDHLSWFNRRRAYLCLDLQMYSRAFKHYFVTLIQEYPDQIEYYQGLFKSAFLLDTKAPSQQQSPVTLGEQAQAPSIPSPNIANQQGTTPVKSTSALAECYDIVEKQCMLTTETLDTGKDQQKGKSAPKSVNRSPPFSPNRKKTLRGPFIARAELFHTIVSNEKVLPKNVFAMCKNQFDARYPTMVSLLLDYFQSFSRKIVCFYDLVHMINEYKLSDEDKRSLVVSVQEWVNSINPATMDISRNDLSNVILNSHMLEHMLHDYKVTDNREERLELAKKYIDLYNANKSLGSFKTEYLAFDNYCLLAINAIMTNSIDLNDMCSKSILTDSLIISLIALAEDTLSYSNHHLKLTLIKLYSFIGASKQSSEHLLSLDIKHFQIDTLGHLLNPVLYNTGDYSHTRETLETCLDFYALGIRECFEGLTTSYRDGRFSKVEEISSVFKRLCNSLNATQCFLLKGIVDNLSAETLDELHGANRSFDPLRGLYRIFRESNKTIAMRDNRDFKVLKSLNIEVDQLVQSRQVQNLDDEQKWLTLRYFILRSMFLQLEYNNISSNNAPNRGANKENYLAELKYAKEAFDNIRPAIDDAISNATDNRYSYFEPETSPFRWKHVNFQSIVSLVEDIAFIPDASLLSPEIQENFVTHLDAVVNNIETQLTCVESLMGMKQALLTVTLSLEFISLAISSLVAINQPYSCSTQSNSKKSSQQQPATNRAKPIPQRLVTKTEAQLTRISQLVKNTYVKTQVLDKLTEPELSVKKDTFNKIKQKLNDNYDEVLVEIELICRRKTKLLRCLFN